ncbi:Glutaredoxin [Quillaja saponaria]|uniref:Glutaredoxin n=1 Tax=Quillaja saponaria TaxID=32244 RepID=A0AAD7PYJ9_QUISA|nr:Glutaredoxin [Quillaja saponaria]
MGCVSSKLVKKDIQQELFFNNGGDYVNHVVSLTSSTYGALKLDNEQPIKECIAESKRLQRSPPHEVPEVINTWELMEDLEDGIPISNKAKKSPKGNIFLRGFVDIDTRSPLKFLNQFGSPKQVKKFAGKENKVRVNGSKGGMRRLDYSPKLFQKASNSSQKSNKSVLNLSFPVEGSPIGSKKKSFGSDSGYLSRRRSYSPLFDPDLLESYDKELSGEEEDIKRMVLPTPKTRKGMNFKDSESILRLYEKRCPPGGENAVVIYTTTLRGIRKTFEDCSNVRSIIESHHIHMFERDISMDSGFKEELRKLLGTKEVKVPLLFVKGRLVGGADEVLKLEEEGKLGLLFVGIPRALGWCEGCAGVRFAMCMDCNGSCKVLDEEHKKMVKCGECNENGLIQCPICC